MSKMVFSLLVAVWIVLFSGCGGGGGSSGDSGASGVDFVELRSLPVESSIKL